MYLFLCAQEKRTTCHVVTREKNAQTCGLIAPSGDADERGTRRTGSKIIDGISAPAGARLPVALDSRTPNDGEYASAYKSVCGEACVYGFHQQERSPRQAPRRFFWSFSFRKEKDITFFFFHKEKQKQPPALPKKINRTSGLPVVQPILLLRDFAFLTCGILSPVLRPDIGAPTRRAAFSLQLRSVLHTGVLRGSHSPAFTG